MNQYLTYSMSADIYWEKFKICAHIFPSKRKEIV